MPAKQLLIVEDEEKVARLLEDYFKLEGYQVSVLLSGEQAVEQVRQIQPDFIILDLMLPGKGGLSICREVRQFSDVPIMMLTARVDEIDRLLGLELGADDYVCKPFLPREVVARVKTILRRTERATATTNNSALLHYQQLRLDTERFQCWFEQQELELTPVELRLLSTLMAQPGRVFSREQLMNRCYQDDRIVSDRTIDSHIKNLRRKLHKVNNSNELIHSIYGVGYKLD